MRTSAIAELIPPRTASTVFGLLLTRSSCGRFFQSLRLLLFRPEPTFPPSMPAGAVEWRPGLAEPMTGPVPSADQDARNDAVRPRIGKGHLAASHEHQRDKDNRYRREQAVPDLQRRREAKESPARNDGEGKYHNGRHSR